MKMNKKIIGMIAAFFLAVILGILSVKAATLWVEDFSCPKDIALSGGSFECTATIKKDPTVQTATLNTLKLYPDSPSWIELGGQEYVSAAGPGSISSENTEVKFSNLKAISAGSNKGFRYIYLDDVQDVNVASDPDSKVNVLDAVVTTENLASSAASGASFTASPKVTTSGSGTLVLSISIDSGGCSIGNQASQKTTTVSGGNNAYAPAPGWTITQGSSGDCRFTLTSTLTGDGGGGTKTTTLSQTVACTNCVTTTTTTTSGGSGGAGGATSTVITPITELTTSITTELGKDEVFGFSFGSVNHTLTVLEITEITATVKIESEPQTFTLSLEEEKQIDLNADGVMDISLRLKSINSITKKATFVLTPLYLLGGGKETGKGGKEAGTSEKPGEVTQFFKEKKNYVLIVFIVLVAIVLIIISLKMFSKAKKKRIKTGGLT